MSMPPDADPNNPNLWFESLANEELDRNNRSVCTWSKYRDDLEETKKILTWLPHKLKHDVMVPIGPRALMRGKIVHTNELLVNLGETWFAKMTATKTIDVCNRRIDKCNEMLDKLKKEEELLRSKVTLPEEKEAFGSEERPEIIEHMTEEEHEEWKKQHRQKEREYRRKLAEMKNKEKKPIETEEDLWNRLDELELREELEDELCRLNAERDSDDYDDDDDDEEDESVTESTNEIGQGDNKTEETAGTDKTEKVTKKRVSFIDPSTTDNEPLFLEIKHTNTETNPPPYNGTINSPSDIYEAYLSSLTPKSILKSNVNVNQEEEMKRKSAIDQSELDEDDDKDDDKDDEVETPVISGIILPDVVARDVKVHDESTAKVVNVNEPARRVSKFKMSRMKKS